MKWAHVADLHLGRRHDTVELIPDQQSVLNEMVDILRDERPDGLIIAGDVYDRAVPPAEAVTLLDSFLTEVSSLCPVLMIAGNHDSGERLGFASGFLKHSGIHIAGVYNGVIHPVEIGDTAIYLLPYLHPALVREALDQPDIHTMDDAVRAALATCAPTTARHRILVAHLFAVQGAQLPERSDSEFEPVGGLDAVDVSAFDGFDYVALGHLHGPQRVGRDTIRYAGSPLPYSFSEEHQHKSLTMIETDEDDIRVRLIPLHAGHRMRTLTGTLDALLDPAFDKGNHEDFIRASLEDTVPQVDASLRLRAVYPNLLTVRYVSMRMTEAVSLSGDVSARRPDELFEDFYRQVTGAEPTPAQMDVVRELMRSVGEVAGS